MEVVSSSLTFGSTKNMEHTLENPCLQFFTDCMIELKRHDVDVRLTHSHNIRLNDENTWTRGAWDDESDPKRPVLKCSVSGPVEDWLTVFAHEYCHFLQWKTRNRAWKRFAKLSGDDLVKVLNNQPIKRGVLKNCIDASIDIELDCERKTVQLLKTYELPFDLGRYVRGANVYLFFYRYLETYRKWYPRCREPYCQPELLACAEPVFYSSYAQIPSSMLTTFNKLYPIREKSRVYE